MQIKLFLGCLARDVPLYLALFAKGGAGYLGIRNRAERLERAPDGSGYRCDWRWTSVLHAPKIIPALGKHLMKRSLSAHPIELGDLPAADPPASPRLTFLIGHRGAARVPHLLATLRSIAAQRGATVECIVVEQDAQAHLRAHLPAWVKLVHTPPPSPDMPYCRSWAFNAGARHARGEVLVLHDNDMVVPVDYAAQILARVTEGYEVVNHKRFIFYLAQAHSNAVLAGEAGLLDAAPDAILQNGLGGGSVAITHKGFIQIGGMDESFVGWGGEDNEFWERAQTLRVWPWAGLPLVHLWHPAQPGKQDADYHTARHYQALTQIPPAERIRRLQAVASGQASGPHGWQAPALAQ